MTPRAPKKNVLRQDGRFVESLLLFLKQLTAHARWVFVALLLLYAVSGIHTIQPQEVALVRRLGQLQPRLHGPGLLIGLPSPFDEVLRFESGKDVGIPLDAWASRGAKIADPNQAIPISDAETRRRMAAKETNGGSIYSEYPTLEGATLDPLLDGYSITSDFNIIQGRFTLRYRIEDPFRFTSAGENIENFLACLGYQAISRELANRPIDASLTSARRELSDGAAKIVQSEVNRLRLGVRVTSLDVRELKPPTQVLATFEDVTNARQFAKTLYENSRQYRAETLAKTEGEAGAIHHRAQGYSAMLVETARGESTSFLALFINYRRQPELVARRILRESLDTAMRRMTSRTLLPAGQAQPGVILEPAPEFSR